MTAPKSYKDPAWDKAEQEAAAKTGVPVELLAAIRLKGERSNADQVSPKGAKGVYQFMPETERLFFKKYGVSAYSTDPVEQATAAAYHLKESYDRTKDWGKAAAGFNGGLKGEKNPRFTQETSEYYDRVVGALPVGLRGPNAEPDPTGTTRRGVPSYDDFMAGRTTGPTGGTGTDARSKVVPAVAFRSRDDDREVQAAIQGVNQEQQAKQAKADAQSWITADGIYDRDSTVGAFYSDMVAPLFKNYDRSTVQADPAYLASVGADSSVAFAGVPNPNHDEQADLLSARSAADRDAIRARLLTKREDEAVMANASTFGALAAGLVTGGLDPFNWVAGIGAAKAFYAAGRGAIALANRGRRGAAVVASAGENALGSVAYEAARGLAGEHQTVADYALAGATGMLPSLLSVPGLSRAASEYHARVNEAVLAKQEVYLRRAAETLGEDAEPVAVRKLAAELEHEDAMATLAATRTRDNKIVAPDLENPEVQAGLKGGETPGAELPAWPEAGRRHNTYEQAAEKYGVTVEIPKAGVGLDAKLGHMAEWRKAQAHAQALVDRYIPGTRIGLQGASDELGAALQLADGSHVIFLQDAADLGTLTHEVGHVVFNTLADKLPEELRLRMREEVAAWGKRLEEDAPRAMRERLGVGRLDTLPETSVLRKTAEGKLDYAGMEAAVKASADDPVAYMAYFRSLDEYGAEQLLKHTEDMLARGKMPNPGVMTQMIQLIRSLVDLFRKAKEEGTLGASPAWAEFFERAAKGEFRETGPQGMVDVESPEFKRWFGDSKIVDADGNPLPLYHGTKHVDGAIDTLRADRNGLIFASKDPAFAEDYAYLGLDGTETFGPVYKVYARAVRPFSLEDKDALGELIAALRGESPTSAEALEDAAQLKKGEDTWQVLERPDVVASIKRLGYDGIWMKEGGSDNLAVMSPEQLKSAVGNTGEFAGTDLHRMANVNTTDTRFGLTALSGADATTSMRRKALRNLIEYCEQEMKANPIDKDKTKTIMKNSLFNMATPGLQLALSDHPVAQWASRHLVENTMGGSGRYVTAAIRKAQYELEFVGAGNNIMDQAFASWKARQGVGLAQGTANDMFKGDLLDAFDRKVYAEIENRRWGKPTSQDPDVIRAADAQQVQYERMLRAQKDNKTVGWAILPDDSVGYISHIFNAGKLGNTSNTRRETMRTIIRDQMVDILGFDREFADKLSGDYMNHARTNANGGHEIPANVLDPHAAEYIRQAAQAAGMTETEIHALGKKLSAGGPSHTKKRLNLDLTREYTDAEGTFTLMDMMNTDVRSLLKNQARRVAGEVAVTQQGVHGSAGLKLMEEALHYTENGKVDTEAVRAFQQVSAELLGRPYGDKMPTLAEGAMTVNAAASLGQMVIPQITETLNMATILGLTSTLKGAVSLPRMIGEVRRLARGEKVDGLLSSMEVPGGEFGMNDYRLVSRWDSPSAMYDTVGRDQLGVADKLIRAAGHNLGKLTFHRLVQAAQVRASAEQITQKALKYIRDGVQDKALADMGISPELAARIKAELPRIAKFDAAGNTVSLDMHKAGDIEAAEQFISAVHRGNGQIIQRAYVGEIGPWQHKTLGKILTQFRTFPITAMEKQWGRQRGLHGAARAMGLVVAVAPFAVPIYLAKVALNAVGRDDPDAYIDRMTTPLALAKGTMNYLGMLGLATDVLDGVTATPVLGTAIKEATGSDDNKRPGTAGGLGSIIPIVGRADRTLQALQGQGGAKALAQSLPFSNTPYVAPFVNALPTDWE